MSDQRSKAEKLRAVIAPVSGATEGERDNARRLLAKMEAKGPSRIDTRPTQGYPRTWVAWADIARDVADIRVKSERSRLQAEELLRAQRRWAKDPRYSPGFSNADFASKRPVRNHVHQVRPDGATVGSLDFDD